MVPSAVRSFRALSRVPWPAGLLLLAACSAPVVGGGAPLALNPAPPPAPRPMLLDIEDYDIHVNLDLVAGHVLGNETITFRALPDAPATRVELDAVDLQILGARDAIGRELPWTAADGLLSVELHDAIPPGGQSTLTLDWSAWPRRGLYVVGPSQADPARPWHCWTQGETHETRYWLPVRDFPDDRATHSLAITVEDRFLTLAAGERLASRRDEKTGRRTDTWSMQVPHPSYLITLVAGDLAQDELPGSSLPLPVVTDAASLPAARAGLAATAEMLGLLENFAGRHYPYPKYAQSLVHDFVAGGQENISATTLTHDALYSAQDAPQAALALDDLVVHEAMHQWFGDLITCRDWGHLWLNEGFATYAELLWHRHRAGDEDARSLVLGWQREMTDAQRGHPEPVVATSWEDPDDLFDTSRYDGAAGRLWLLAQELGEETFTAGVRRYVHDNEARSVTTDALREAMEAASHRELSGWFEEWITGAGFPVFEVRIADDGSPRLLVRQVQAGEGGRVFHLPVEVQWSRGGHEHSTRLAVDAASEELALDGEGPLDWVRFDGRCAVPGEVDLQQDEAAWRSQLLAARDGVTRLVAAQWFSLDPAVAFGDVGSGDGELQPESLAALARAARTDTFPPVRTSALAALAARAPDDDDSAARLLLELAADPDPGVRAMAAAGLSDRGDEAGAAVLLHLAQDSNGPVAVAALGSLVQRRDPQAFDIGRRLATDPDALRGPLRADALAALAGLDDEPGVAPLLVAAVRVDADVAVRITALHALRDLPDLPTSVKLRVFGEALWDASYRLRIAAAQALSRWPTAEAHALLAARAAIETDPTVLRALQAPRRAAAADD